ncbi:unnamed protein product [Adineta steineri]|uniref:Uncharacterized protein n=1 Tax=Adineta steineri TaxID=433720 RepID=A0A814LV41_9BILA|nr:unnamed protein product [Adineta steineri]CAF1115352.1 unnamed protein product [Adineta steineri]CAF1399069.1 unnamed protein product [Adineta steineri]CAF1497487.1 unnamed protein product [Adineta steineri]CAF1613568.1 unnamed protein product [Adineta steineri]
MYTLLNSTNSTINRSKNDSDRVVFTHSSTSSTLDNISSIFLISILSVLCFLGVIFMIFGPMMRSEAWKRVDNYIFGQDMEHEDQDEGGADNGDG